MKNHKVKCSNFEIGNDIPFTLIAGPCQLENEEHALKISSELKKNYNLEHEKFRPRVWLFLYLYNPHTVIFTWMDFAIYISNPVWFFRFKF